MGMRGRKFLELSASTGSTTLPYRTNFLNSFHRRMYK